MHKTNIAINWLTLQQLNDWMKVSIQSISPWPSLEGGKYSRNIAFLSLTVEQDWDSSLPLNVLLYQVNVLCRVWHLFRMENVYWQNWFPRNQHCSSLWIKRLKLYNVLCECVARGSYLGHDSFCMFYTVSFVFVECFLRQNLWHNHCKIIPGYLKF